MGTATKTGPACHIRTSSEEDTPYLSVFTACHTIRDKEYYFVDRYGELQGYRWWNVAGAVWLGFENWRSRGKLHQEAGKKITETFRYLLAIPPTVRIEVRAPNQNEETQCLECYNVRWGA